MGEPNIFDSMRAYQQRKNDMEQLYAQRDAVRARLKVLRRRQRWRIVLAVLAALMLLAGLAFLVLDVRQLLEVGYGRFLR